MKVKSNVKAGGDASVKEQHNQTVVRGLKVKTNVRAGDDWEKRTGGNHNQTVVRGLKVKSNVKAGALTTNHNQTINRASKGMHIKSNVKAGGFASTTLGN